MEYLENPTNIRNICVLAHVDHGKTTIADSLIASNGIISHRMAGKLRYMDSRPEEQERGITMKSSSIALKYSPNLMRKEDKIQQKLQRYLINLIDTPGHVDFCGEVSAAVRLCDGALIVVDVVEGVYPQTIAALEQAWKEGIEPILIFNKLDRLIVEQKLDETAAYLRLEQLLEQINAIVATLLTTEIFESDAQNSKKEDDSKLDQNSDNPTSNVYDWASAIEDIDDDKYYFRPEKNNVIFASAIDDWAFTIDTFAQFLAEKHKINLSALQKTLWGDYYVDKKQQRIFKGAQAKAKKNLFISMVLENIWKMYDTVIVRRDKVRMEKICQVLNIEISSRDLNHSDARHQIKVIMSKWLPLSRHVLDIVSKLIPSPTNLSEKRVERLLCSSLRKFDQLPPQTRDMKQSFLKCSSNDESVKIACISKMLPYEKKNLTQIRTKIRAAALPKPDPNTKDTTIPQTNDSDKQEDDRESDVVFIAFARIFSGKINKGDKLYVLGPRHDPSSMSLDASLVDASKKLEDLGFDEHITIATVEDLFLLMGRDLESVDHIDAGNIIGIQGLDKHLIRTGTLSSSIFCPPFYDWFSSSTPILRVAIEPKNPQEMPMLINGLKLLNQADPCVEVKLQQTGEHVIVATGELHLQHCIRDLKERYTNGIELNISQPIVPFRETIVLPRKVDMVNEAIGDRNTDMTSSKTQSSKNLIEILTPNKKCLIRMKAFPLPPNVQKFMADKVEVLKIIHKITTSRIHKDSSQLDDTINQKLEKFKYDLGAALDESRKESNQWKHQYAEGAANNIWSFGPKYSGPNVLLGSHLPFNYNVWSQLKGTNEVSATDQEDNDLRLYIDSFISGFQLATQAGPLCEEPMLGVCFTIHDWKCVDSNSFLNAQNEDGQSEKDAVSIQSGTQRDTYGPFSGQIISTVKEACRKSFQNQPQRLMSPMFSCEIQVTSDVLGKMYAVLGRRHGRILHGDMREGSQTFEIKALIPVIESIDFVGEIRKQTSGLANPQLIFSHYEIIDVDPFWTPSTEEEYALFGEKADTENQAKKYMNLVRKRKGLHVQEKIVEHGEKQRTIKRNK